MIFDGREFDNCQLCHGMNGGVRGNENRLALGHLTIVVCDYCYVALRTWAASQVEAEQRALVDLFDAAIKEYKVVNLLGVQMCEFCGGSWDRKTVLPWPAHADDCRVGKALVVVERARGTTR